MYGRVGPAVVAFLIRLARGAAGCRAALARLAVLRGRNARLYMSSVVNRSLQLGLCRERGAA